MSTGNQYFDCRSDREPVLGKVANRDASRLNRFRAATTDGLYIANALESAAIWWRHANTDLDRRQSQQTIE